MTATPRTDEDYREGYCKLPSSSVAEPVHQESKRMQIFDHFVDSCPTMIYLEVLPS